MHTENCVLRILQESLFMVIGGAVGDGKGNPAGIVVSLRPTRRWRAGHLAADIPVCQHGVKGNALHLEGQHPGFLGKSRYDGLYQLPGIGQLLCCKGINRDLILPTAHLEISGKRFRSDFGLCPNRFRRRDLRYRPMGQIGDKLVAALCRAKCQGPQHMGVLGHREAVPELHRAILLP